MAVWSGPYAELVLQGCATIGDLGGVYYGDYDAFVAKYSDVSMPGDFDGDGDVDGNDFLTWQRGESPIPLSSSDLTEWQENFGNVTSSMTAASTGVPEPTTGLMLMLGMAAMLFRRESEHLPFLKGLKSKSTGMSRGGGNRIAFREMHDEPLLAMDCALNCIVR